MKFRELAFNRTLWIGNYRGNPNTLYRLYVYKAKAIRLGTELPDQKIKPFLQALGVKFMPRQYGLNVTCVGCSIMTTSNLAWVRDRPEWMVDEELQAFYNSLGNRSVVGLLFSDEEKSTDRLLASLRDGITGELEGDAEELDEAEVI